MTDRLTIKCINPVQAHAALMSRLWPWVKSMTMAGHELRIEARPATRSGDQNAKFHAIVSDIGMPQMDGYQFMRAWRATEARTERIPALALTAFARSEDRKRALLAGYQAHLAKPFDVAEFFLLVADLVGR